MNAEIKMRRGKIKKLMMSCVLLSSVLGASVVGAPIKMNEGDEEGGRQSKASEQVEISATHADTAGINCREIGVVAPFEIYIATYNILGAASKGYENWEDRRQSLVDMVIADFPDVIGTQEMRYREIPNYLNKWLAPAGYASFPETTLGLPSYRDPYDVVLYGQPLEGRHWQNWLYYKADKFEKIDGGQIALREAPEVSFINQRSVNWLHLKDKGTGAEFVVMNTHWQPGPKRQKQREIEAAHMKEFILSFPEELPVVAIGDFNAHSDAPEIQMLISDGLLEEAVKRERHIDHIMQRNFSVVPGSDMYELKKDREMDISDHPMLSVKLVVNGK
jgi:endonuclease/exonuclease/phosphatase family metal-dependent hydrolase